MHMYVKFDMCNTDISALFDINMAKIYVKELPGVKYISDYDLKVHKYLWCSVKS